MWGQRVIDAGKADSLCKCIACPHATFICREGFPIPTVNEDKQGSSGRVFSEKQVFVFMVSIGNLLKFFA
jgi:hypothetical protein